MKWPMSVLCLFVLGCGSPTAVDLRTDWTFTVLKDGRTVVKRASVLFPLPDGGYLIGDENHLDRYSADGRKDTHFSLALSQKGAIRSIGVRSGGSILIGRQSPGGLQQFLPDGTLDPAFHSLNIPVLGFGLRSDGRILVVSSDIPRLAGYLPDGTRERSWRGSVQLDGRAASPSWATTLPGDRILLSGAEWVAVLRANESSALATRVPGLTCDPPMVAAPADGKLVVGCGQSFTRILPDGTLEASLQPAAKRVLAIAAQSNTILMLDDSGQVSELK